MNDVERTNCTACDHVIDAAARVCPYCGADPRSGERPDTRAILDEVFHPRTISASESVMEYARQRQGIVIAISAMVAFLVLAALHQFVSSRNENAVTDSPAVPLSELADAARAPETPQPMPELDFQYSGRPVVMQRWIVERGAVRPAPAVPAPAPTAAAPAAAAPPVRPQGAAVPAAPRPVTTTRR